VTQDKGIKKISAKAIMVDLKAGLSDLQLMEKYAISYGALQDLFSKLVGAGLATQAYFNKRALKQSNVLSPDRSAQTCPHCGYSAAKSFSKCPRCEQKVSDWLNTVELTSILGGSFH